MQIYKITNIINLKIYIGKDTTANPNYFGSGVILKKAIKKYGKENFIKEIIDSAETKEDLSKKEKYWILYYDSTNRNIGYNISKGGDGGDTISNNPNKKFINKKISESCPTRGKKYEDVYGPEKTLEYKRKLSEAHKKRIRRPKKEKEKREDKRKTRWVNYHKDKQKEIKNFLQSLKDKIESEGVSNFLVKEIELAKKKRIYL